MNRFRLEQMVNNNFIYLPKYKKHYEKFGSLKSLIECYHSKCEDNDLKVILWNHDYSDDIREIRVRHNGEMILYTMKDVKNLDNVPSKLHTFIKEYSENYIKKLDRLKMIDNILNNG